MSSALANGLDTSEQRLTYPAAVRCSNGGRQPDPSGDLALSDNNLTTKGRLWNDSYSAHVENPLRSQTTNSYSKYIVISPQPEVQNGDSYEGKINALSASGDAVMGFGGYYSCQGHSVESVLQSYQVDMPVVHMPLDLSKPSKKLQSGDTQSSSKTIASPHDQSLDLSTSSLLNHDVAQKTIDIAAAEDDSSCVQKLSAADANTISTGKARQAGSGKRRKSKEVGDDTEVNKSLEESKSRRMRSKSKREEPSQCSFCSKWFCSSWSRISHERTHTGQNRHYCKVCHRSFPIQHNHKGKLAQGSTSELKPDVLSTTTHTSSSAQSTALTSSPDLP